jgi:hypothetical protein
MPDMIVSLRSLCLLSALAVSISSLAMPAMAQLAEPIPQRRGTLAKPIKPEPRAEAMLPCPAYGPGFFRQPGSQTCIRVSGSVRGEVGIQGRRSRLNDSSGLNSQARMMLDTRTPTEFGTLRAVMSVRGQTSSGTLAGVR